MGDIMGRHKGKIVNPKESTEKLIEEAMSLFQEPFDNRSGRYQSLPTLRSVADSLGITILKTRKLLISGGYFTTDVGRRVQEMAEAGKSVEEIVDETGLSCASVYSYLPYKGIAFNLRETTMNADRHRLFRARKKAVQQLQNSPTSLHLWEAIVLFTGYTFSTSGQGKNEGVQFKYRVPEASSKAGKQYAGESVKGYVNELFIDGREKSIARSSVDYALKLVMEGGVTGPKGLKTFGASYVYAIFKRFGLVYTDMLPL